MKKTFVLFCIIFSLSISCAINPVTGKKELSLFSEQEELALGQKTDLEIRSQYGVYEDSSLTVYIQSVGKKLVPYTHRPQLTYHFAVLDSPVINAFAVPGGYIYVTRGILALMGSESELSAVLGHELGHVNARHSLRRVSKLILVQLGLSLGSAISETFAKISGMASIGIQFLFLKYSRDDEREADALGVEYTRKATYNPGEIVRFFHSLDKLGDLSGGHSLPGFLSTHPLTDERIENVKQMLLESDSQLQVKLEAYLQQIENIVYGPDPHQGFAEENTFYHPQLAFMFSFPPGWKVQNTPSQVTLSPEDGNAAVILQVEKSEAALADYAQKKASSIEGRQFINDMNATINSLASYHQVYDIRQEEKETLRARLSFIKKGPYIYSFAAMSTALDFKRYDTSFQSIVNSFEELKNSAFLSRKPRRMKLVRANGRQKLKEIFQDAGMEKEVWPTFTILNGMEPEAVPPKSQLIKIVK